jgi:hypothetical protein
MLNKLTLDHGTVVLPQLHRQMNIVDEVCLLYHI